PISSRQYSHNGNAWTAHFPRPRRFLGRREIPEASFGPPPSHERSPAASLELAASPSIESMLYLKVRSATYALTERIVSSTPVFTRPSSTGIGRRAVRPRPELLRHAAHGKSLSGFPLTPNLSRIPNADFSFFPTHDSRH